MTQTETSVFVRYCFFNSHVCYYTILKFQQKIDNFLCGQRYSRIEIHFCSDGWTVIVKKSSDLRPNLIRKLLLFGKKSEKVKKGKRSIQTKFCSSPTEKKIASDRVTVGPTTIQHKPSQKPKKTFSRKAE
jgi:hypothetical protein